MALTNEEARAIEERVRRSEQRTAGELVVAVAEQSDSYARERAAGAGIFALVCGVFGQELMPWTSPLWFFALQVPIAVAAYWLLGLGPLLRVCVSRAQRAERVDRAAFQVFAERGIANTKERSGVLIYVSLGERQVRILADRGIHERAGQQEWEADVALIVEGMRRQDPVQGIGSAVDRIGDLLAEFFPRAADDQNELSDEVLSVR